MPTTRPLRVPESIHQEVSAAAQMLGETPSVLLARAWDAYKGTSDFQQDFNTFQKAYATGDFDIIVSTLSARSHERARQKAARAADPDLTDDE